MSGREVMVGGKPLSSLRVVDLKAELEKVGLSKSGSKKELSDRLKNHLVIEREREGAAAAATGDEEQLPNISMQDKLAEDNPFIREYFASQAELYHSQKVVKKLYQEEQIRESEGSGTSADEREKSPVKAHRESVPSSTQALSSPGKHSVLRDVESVAVLESDDRNGTIPSASGASAIESTSSPSSPSKEQMSEGNKTVEQHQQQPDVEKQGVEIENPVDESESPVVHTDEVAENIEKPAVDNGKPAVHVAKPAVETEKPAVETEKPAVETEKPAVEIEKPPVDVEEPAVDVEEPAVDVEKPPVTVDVEKPAVDIEKPTFHEIIPVVEPSNSENKPKKSAVDLENPPVNVEKVMVEVEKAESDETESSESSDEEEKSSLEKTPDRESEAETEPAIDFSSTRKPDKPIDDIQDSPSEPNSANIESKDTDADLLVVTESSTEELVPPPPKKPAVIKSDKENVQVEKKSRIIPITFDKEDTKVKKGPIRTISFTKTEGKVVIQPVSKREIQPPTEEVPLAPSDATVNPGIVRSMSQASASSNEGAAADEALDYGEEEGPDDQKAEEQFSMEDYEHVPIVFEPRVMSIKPNSHSQRRDEARVKAEKENQALTGWPGEFDEDEVDSFELTSDILLTWYPATNIQKEEDLEENPVSPPGSPMIDIDETFRITRTFSTTDMSPTDDHMDSAEEDLRHKMDTSIMRKVSMVSIGDEGPKELTPPKHAPTPIIIVTNLVRPFTLPQLKELLQRTGNVLDLWVDKIKSKCVAKYDSENEAIETRTALHGVRWPVSNPKCLSVDFTTERVFEDLRRKDSGEPEIKVKEKPEPSQRQVSIREWDLGKRRKSRSPEDRKRSTSRDRKRRRHSRSPQRDKDRRDQQSGETKKKPEPSGKALDELFRKTVTTPCIYWLPLNPQQIAEKEEHRRKRMEERERRIAEMQKQQRHQR